MILPVAVSVAMPMIVPASLVMLVLMPMRGGRGNGDAAEFGAGGVCFRRGVISLMGLIGVVGVVGVMGVSGHRQAQGRGVEGQFLQLDIQMLGFKPRRQCRVICGHKQSLRLERRRDVA